MAEKKVEKVEEAKPKELFELVEVPTGSALAFKTPEGNIITGEQMLVQIANELMEIKKGLL